MENIQNQEFIAMPRIGDQAPSFKAVTTQGPINFPEDYKGNWVILFSHPADFTPVCTSEFMTFASLEDKFDQANCKLVGLSVDGLYSHIAWLRTIKEKIEYKGMKDVEVKFPLIEDITMDVAKKYGMMMLEDMFGIYNIRKRRELKWKKLIVQSRVVLNTSFILIAAGAIIFLIIEHNNSLNGYSIAGRIVTSVFQSVTCRTAGFNTIDFTHLSQPVLIFMMLLMYIGASPGSTGGGIKTTTFAIIIRSAWNTIRGRKSLELQKHTVSNETINKAYSIALFSLSLIFISTFFLSITDGDKEFIKLLFEEISAFGTVGLSTGITPFLSDPGKVILILTMFIGRIGTLTLALALTNRVAYTKYRYSEINIMVG